MNGSRQIYIAGALTAADEKSIVTYEIIDQVCSEAGFEAYLPHRDTGPRNNVLDPREVFVKNATALQNSVAVIAEVSIASFGVGMECEYALRSGIPLIAVAKQGAVVSRMLEGHPAIERVLRYDNVEQLRAVLLPAVTAALKPSVSHPGMFIIFEGMDGSGKSTLAARCRDLYSKKFPDRSILLIKDPPDLEPWGDLRERFSQSSDLSAASEALLLLASRVDQCIRSVKPILDGGGVVFADRFHDSWLIYQAERLARHLNVKEEEIDYFLNLATVLVRSIRAFIMPDHVFIFTGDPAVLHERLVATRPQLSSKYETPEFARKIRDRYIALYERASTRMSIVDTTRRTPEDIFSFVTTYIDRELLPSL